jgi:hypothetical protein
MTGSTGSESWGRSDVTDVGEAVGINLVMHSVPGPGGRQTGPGQDMMHSVPDPAGGQTDSNSLFRVTRLGAWAGYYACSARRIQVHRLRPGIQCAAGRAG